jgi:hypothetical protein
MSDYDRLLETAMREFERQVVSLVEREFEHIAERMETGVCQIPVIGGEFPPPDRRDGLQARVRRALCARRWFEFEAAPWAQPLPVSASEISALFNRPNRRLYPVADYGLMLREMSWRYQHAMPFEEFTAQYLEEPGFWRFRFGL